MVNGLTKTPIDWKGKAVKILGVLPQIPDDLEVKVIIMRRDIDKALQSGWNMLDAMGKPRTQTKEFWQGDLDAIRKWSASKPHIEVWFEDIFRNTPNECMRLLKLLYPGYKDYDIPPLDLAAMAKVVDPSLRHL